MVQTGDKFMKKSFYLILSFLIIVLASCKNFMNAGDVQKEIENMIKEANAKSITLVISQDNTMGTFLSSGDKECKLGYSINVQFNLKKDAYIFKGIKAVSTTDEEASRDDCIEFTITDRDDDKGIYKIAIKVVKEANDIMIVPDCILVPGVVKEECFPSFDASGWEQDSTIRIAFNKPVIATEEFGVIITDVGGSDMSTFYGEPFFSADKTTLFIPINKSKKIINDDDNISTKDIIVKIDLTTIKDEEENTGSGLFEYKFRVNKTKDTEPPTFVSANVYTSSDKTRQLTTNHPDTWTNESDYSANHLRNSVFVEFQATDEGSGISGIFVKEKIIKFSDGTAASESEEAISYHSDDTCVLDETTGNYVLNYTIGTLYDGIIQLQIFPEDYSFNHSTGSKTVYVLKDTTIESGRVKFLQELGQFENTQEAWLNNIPTVMENDNDKQKIVLTLSPDAKDYYYGNYATEYELKVSWKYENDNDKDYKLLTKNNQNSYEFIRDVNKLVFIKVECKDILGNIKTIIKRMAPRLELQYSEMEGIGVLNFQSILLLNGIQQNNQGSPTNLRDYCIPLYRYYYDSEHPEIYYEVVDTGAENTIGPTPIDLTLDVKRCYDLIEDENKPSTPVGPLRMYLIPTIGDFPAPISINYISANITEYNPATTSFVLANQQASSTNTGTVYTNDSGPGDVSYFNDTLKITTTPLENSGCYRVKIDDYMTQAGIDNNVTYTFFALAWQKKDPNLPDINLLYNLSSKSKSPEFLLTSENNYRIYIEGTDSQGNTYIPYPYPSLFSHTDTVETDLNSYSFYLNSSTSTTTNLDLTKDLSAPYLPKNDNPFSEPGSYSIPFPEDGNPQSPLYNGPSIIKNKYGNAEISYYIIPVPTGNRKYVPSYTLEELETYYKDIKQTIEFPYGVDPNMTENKISVPYNDLSNGFYTISFVTQDVNNNKFVETYPFIKNSLGKLPYSLIQDTLDWSFTLNPSNNPEIKLLPAGNDQYKPSVEIYLQACDYMSEMQPSTWQSPSSFNQLIYTQGTGDKAGLFTNSFGTADKPPFIDLMDPNAGRWYRIRAIYGFNDSDSTSGKGFYDYEYVFLGNPDCAMTNCVEGINGIQVYCDNKVLAHTLYSKTKLTNSKYEKNAASIWENKGAEIGLRIINNDPVNTSTYEKPVKMFTYSASNYDFVPTGYYYTTIFHFANGSVAMTDIKQKE